MLTKEQKQIVRDIKKSIENTDRFHNCPDTIFFNSGEYNYNGSYDGDISMEHDYYAAPFIYFTAFNANIMFYGGKYKTHGDMGNEIVDWLFNYYDFELIMDKIAERTAFRIINENLEDAHANYDDFFAQPSKYIRLGQLLDWTNTDVMLCGRYYIINVPEINQTFTIIAFWDRNNVASVQRAAEQLCREQNLGNTQVYIANGTYEMLSFNSSFSPVDLQSNDDDKMLQIMHLMKSDDKKKATSDFRDTRDRMLGRKLTNRKTGQEMPMAQYNALRYVDEGKELLQEINVLDKYKLETSNGKTNLDFNTYWGICAIDPTFTNHNVGKYGNWLLQHVTPEMALNDEMNSKIYNTLKLYNAASQMGVLKRNGVSNDIGSFKTVDELISAIEKLQGQGALFSQRESNGMEKLKGQYKIVSETQNWYVVEPLTFEAEQFFGGGTRWCTVAKEFTFRDYRNNSPLYIAIPKGDLDSKKRMQFQFPEDGSDSDGDYADVYDEVFHNPKKCIYHIIGNTGAEYQELCRLWSAVSSDKITFCPSFNSFNLVFKEDVPKLLKQGVSFEKIFDDYWGESQTVYGVMLDGKYNYVNKNTRELASDVWVDYTNEAGYVECDGLVNFINKKTGKYIWNKPYIDWFDAADSEWNDNGEAHVLLRGKDYWLNQQGKLRQCKSELNESNRVVLSENRESKNMGKARQLLYQHGYSTENAFKILDTIRTDVPNSRLADCKFLLGVTRLYLNGELSDGTNIQKINKALKYIASDAHVNEYDNNLNGLSVQELDTRFASVAQTDLEGEKTKLAGKQYTRNENYTIVPIDTPQAAKKYSNYTSWCVTHDARMYNSYTNNGLGRFYFCLRNDFKIVPEEQGENCPLDSYGLSMIAVSVNIDGSCNTITCRWNHDNGGNDSIMTPELLSEVLGVNFYEVFKPYTREELHAKGKILFDEVPELLAQGASVKRIFEKITPSKTLDGYYIVSLNGLENVLHITSPDKQPTKCELISPDIWFNTIYDAKEGMFILSNNQYERNFLSKEGKLLSPNQWFRMVEVFSEGFACVSIGYHLWNYIDTDGNLLFPNIWLESTASFNKNKRAFVLNNGEYFLINTNGELVSETPFYSVGYAGNFTEGFAEVMNKDEYWNYIDENGNILSGQWFNKAYPFHNGFGVVRLNNKENFINANGELLSPNQWFYRVTDFSNGVSFVFVDDYSNFNVLTKNGQLLYPVETGVGGRLDVDTANYGFQYGYAEVIQYGTDKKNLISKTGKLVSPNYWFNDIWVDSDKDCFVEIKNKHGRMVDFGFDIKTKQLLDYNTGEPLSQEYLNSKGVDYQQPSSKQMVTESTTGKRIYLTEAQMQYIKEHKDELLTESTRDNLLLPYLNILQQKGQNVTLGELKVYLMRKFVTEANIHALSQNSNYYLAGVARYYFNGDLTTNKQLNVFYPRVTDKFIPEVCTRLDEIIMYLRNAYIDNRGLSFEQPEDFGTLSIAQLFKKYSVKIDKLKQKYAVLDNANTIEGKPINTSVSKNYTFDIMYSHEDCKKYNQATSPGAWCITYGQQHYNAYTKRNSAHFVIFVKNGYENIPRKVGQGFPLDEYGLSLIAVQQSNVDGHFVCATTRWNHGGYGGAPNVPNADYALTYEQLKKVTGVSDDKFQEIFNIWKENGGNAKTIDRLSNQREKIDVVRKFKYAEILLRNGSTLQQLAEDKRINHAKLLYPANIEPQNVKVNKSILGLCIVENEKEYWTIMDRGVVKPDEILCDNISLGTWNQGHFNWVHNHGGEFALCDKKDKYMIYMYKQHSLLDVDGNKFWHKVNDITDNLSLIKCEITTRYKAHEPFIIWDWNKNQPIMMPNGRCVSEETQWDNLKDYNIPFIYMVGDSAAKEYYFYSIERNQFIEELDGYQLYNLLQSQHILILINPNEEGLVHSQYYTESSTWKPKYIYDVNEGKFIQPMGDTPIYGIDKLNNYISHYGVKVNEALEAFRDDYVIMTIAREPELTKVMYNYKTKEPLRYPNGDIVYFKHYDVIQDYDILVMSLPTKGYSWEQTVIYNIPEQKFYKNEDGSLIFNYYGGNTVYDKYRAYRELPKSTDGPYWYEQQKTKIDDVDKLLAEGVPPEEIFDNTYSSGYENYEIVELNRMFNIYLKNENRMLLDNWVTTIYPFKCNRALIETNVQNSSTDGCCNFITPEGKYLLQENVSDAKSFDEESKRAVIRKYRYGGWNLIDVNGKRMAVNDFKYIGDFHKDTLCYDALKFDTRKTRYMSIYGHLFDKQEDAYQDSLHGEPQIDEYYREHPEVAEYDKKYQIAESKNFDAAARTHFKVSGESLDKYAHVIDDVIEEIKNTPFVNKSNRVLTRESIDELCSPEELNDVMDSFDVQKQLNEKFWDEDKHLNPRIRMRLLDIADSFYNSMETTWVTPTDVIMTGSLCNYNWSKFSDVDLHVVVDFAEVDERTNFVKDYFDSKKKIWNDTHDNLTIYGFPVEVYVQDENEEHTASGIYSLYKDEWIVEPSYDNFGDVELDKEMIANKVQSCAEKIDALEGAYAEETDEHKIDEISKKVKKLFDKIKGIRKTSLQNGGELSAGNILFKSLRRLGYIGKLVDLKTKTYDKINSIK